uniref:Tudor domain-containing protein n=1 Tax=Glossina austeni TaxID=7395 RepID=A0A1A9VTL4_GLOAU
METKEDQMKTMHLMCQKEVEQLFSNLDKFLIDSERAQKVPFGCRSNGSKDARDDGSSAFALIAFDRYMSQVGTILNMARKFNIHLQLHTLGNGMLNVAEVSGGMSQSRLIEDFFQWSNILMGQELDRYVARCDNRTLNGSKETGHEVDKIASTKGKAIEAAVPKVSSTGRTVSTNHLKPLRKIQFQSHYPSLEDVLGTMLPKKNLDHFKAGTEFEASITYVQNYKELVFYICELSDYPILFELSGAIELQPIKRPLVANSVFCITQNKKSTEERKECVWRAVMVPGQSDCVLLIDFGEIVSLNERTTFYRLPPKYQNIPPMAIKCTLEGACDMDGYFNAHQEYCEMILRSNEFKIVQFRVSCRMDQALHLVLLEPLANKLDSRVHNNVKANPFVNLSSEDERDDRDPLPLPISILTSLNMDFAERSDQLMLKGYSLQITVTHVINPVSFYAIIGDLNATKQRDSLSWPDNEVPALQKQIIPPNINDLLLSQYIKDGYWYRAKVVDIDQKRQMYKVFYIDFGNTEIVPLCCLAKCTEQIMQSNPARAVRFRLANLIDNTACDEARRRKAIDTIAVIILNQTASVEVIGRNDEEIIVRFIDGQFVDIPDILLSLGVVEET